MKTVHDIIDILYGIINVETVTDLLGEGEVCRHSKPLNSELMDITIRSLVNLINVDTQSPVVNVNCYVKDLSEGIPDEPNLEVITNAVVTVLEAYIRTAGTYFKIDIVSQLLLQDVDHPQMSYSNIRLNCTIER